MKKEGLFITFEGGDGVGKSTLIGKVFDHLEKEGQAVLKTRAPGGTEIGQEIRNLLLHKQDASLSKRCELLLFLADRAQHVDEQILPALEKGKIVLCDRFNDSTVAYQGGARGLTPEIVSHLCHFACNGLTPDLTLYLDLDPKIGFERAKQAGMAKDRIESETLEFHQKIRETFRQIADNEPSRFVILDASKTAEEVFQLAKERIDALLQLNRE
jgi:dTMP kinase